MDARLPRPMFSPWFVEVANRGGGINIQRRAKSFRQACKRNAVAMELCGGATRRIAPVGDCTTEERDHGQRQACRFVAPQQRLVEVAATDDVGDDD